MHTLVIESVNEFAECLLIRITTIKRTVVFARNAVNLPGFQGADANRRRQTRAKRRVCCCLAGQTCSFGSSPTRSYRLSLYPLLAIPSGLRKYSRGLRLNAE